MLHSEISDTVFLIRDEIFPSAIRGILIAGERTFHTIERPWRQNLHDISCIPAGIYHARFLEISSSGKYHNVYHLIDVPGRSGILIHYGNIVDHTKGCIIIGADRVTMANQPAICKSRSALSDFLDIMNKSSFTLHIIGNQSL